MFKYVSTHFADATGRGSLIAVNSVDQASSIKLLQVVVMERKREYGLWTKKVYRPYDFLLGDLLLGTKSGSPINVNGKQSEFCTWKKNFTFTIKGKFGAGIMHDLADVNVRSNDKVTVQANLGQVNMTKVDSEELLAALSDRRLNIEHTLIQQIRQNKKKVLCIVTAVAQLEGNAAIHRVSNKGGAADAEAEKKDGGADGGGDEGGGDGEEEADAGGDDGEDGGGDDDGGGCDDEGGDEDAAGDDDAGGDDAAADDAGENEGGGEENDETADTNDDGDASGEENAGDNAEDGGDDSGGGDTEEADDSGGGEAEEAAEEPAAEEPAADAPPPGVKLRKEIGLCKGTVVAFKVWELEIARKSGRVVPCVLQGQSGGFKPDHMVGSGKKFLDLITP